MNRLPFSLSALLIMGTFLSTGSAQPPSPPAAESLSPAPDPNAPPPSRGALRQEPVSNVNQNAYTRKGTIKAFNSAPDGTTNGVILQDGTTVLFPPEMGNQLHSLAKEGTTITVSGTDRPGISGRLVDAQSITARGQLISVTAPKPPAAGAAAPAPPAPPRGRGKALRPEPPPPPPGPKGEGAHR